MILSGAKVQEFVILLSACVSVSTRAFVTEADAGFPFACSERTMVRFLWLVLVSSTQGSCWNTPGCRCVSQTLGGELPVLELARGGCFTCTLSRVPCSGPPVYTAVLPEGKPGGGTTLPWGGLGAREPLVSTRNGKDGVA